MLGAWLLAGCLPLTTGTAVDHATTAAVPLECGERATPMNPPLVGWAPKGRAALRSLTAKGVVAVKYSTEGCSVRLIPVDGCKINRKYRWSKTGDTHSALIRNRESLLDALPLDVERFDEALRTKGALRVDQFTAGVLKIRGAIKRSDLAERGCEKATHLITAVHLGQFVLAAGTPQLLEGADLTGQPGAGIEILDRGGRSKACRHARTSPKRAKGCDAPLLVELMALMTPSKASKEKPQMVRIAAGEFERGDEGSKSGAGPKKTIFVDEFELDRTEVTAVDYAACVLEGACTAAGGGKFCTGKILGKERHPVNCVSWKQADAYCKFVGKRLPTEAEWERAARGTDARGFVWGNEWPPPASAGNFADAAANSLMAHWNAIPGFDDGHAGTGPVDALEDATSPSGAIAMAGNVAEWVDDWYDSDYYKSAPTKNPPGPKRGKAKVVRGASFGDHQKARLRVTHRDFYDEDVTSMHVGFRCAKTPAVAPAIDALPEGDAPRK